MSAIFYRLFRSRYDKLQNLRQFVWNCQGMTARRRNTYLMEQMENRYLLSADASPLALSTELLNEELMVEQLVDAGLAEAANQEGLQLVRQHDYDLKNPVTEADNESVTLEAEQTISDQSDTQTNAEEVKPEADAALAEEISEAATSIQYVQQLSGHQMVVIDRSVEDYRALLSTFMGAEANELDWHAETTDAGEVQIADWLGADETTDEQAQLTSAENNDEPLAMPVELPTQADRVTVVLLDAQGDGVEQISQLVSDFDDISALHVLSHGAAGALRLGSASLNSLSLERYRQQLEAWGRALKSDGDILLYGCNISQGAVGIAFVDRLAGVTEADIAASDDLTGNHFIGGDWILETETGYITETLELVSTEQAAFASNDPKYAGLLETVDNQTVIAAIGDLKEGGNTIDTTDSNVKKIDLRAIGSSYTATTSHGTVAGTNNLKVELDLIDNKK